MAAIPKQTAGFSGKLYKTAALTTLTPIAIAALAIPGNEVKGVSSMGEIAKARSTIDIPVYGADQSDQIPGQIEAATFEFSYTLDRSDTVHKAITDDAGTTSVGWIIAFTVGAAITYVAFNGRVLSANTDIAIDSAITVNASVARQGAVTWVDKA